MSAGKVANVPPPARAFIAPPTQPAPAASPIAARSGSARRLAAALAFGSRLELSACRVDVPPAGGAHRRGNAVLEHDVAERLDPLLCRTFVRRSGPRVERN